MQLFLKGGIASPAKSLKVPFDILPAMRAINSCYRAQIIPFAQSQVTTPQTTDHHLQPAHYKPWAHQTIRMNFLHCPQKAFPASLPVLQPRKKGTDHGCCRVLHIRNQLDREQGKGLLPCFAQKSGNRNPFIPEIRKKIDGITLVRVNPPATVALHADGANRTDHQKKINLSGGKCILIFPDALKCVKKWQLYV